LFAIKSASNYTTRFFFFAYFVSISNADNSTLVNRADIRSYNETSSKMMKLLFHSNFYKE